MSYLSEHAIAGSATARRYAIGLALLLVALAFGRAQFFSSTGIRIAGDGADYAAIAEAGELRGRAPFVYRPAVPLLVGTLFAGRTTLGFAVVCGLALFAALLLAARLPRDPVAGYSFALLLLLNYQVLFSPANPGRLDAVVLAVQLGFVALALRGREALFFALLPLAALVKESLLPALLLLVLAAFPRRRDTFAKAAVAATLFAGIHLLVRIVARPTAWLAPYAQGSLDTGAALALLGGHLTAWLPLQLFVAWGGLCLVVLHACASGGRRGLDAPLAVAAALVLAFPLPLVTDLNRAWFELLAPLALYLLLGNADPERRPLTRPLLAMALAASLLPYLVKAVAPEHLYLLILEQRLTVIAAAALAACLALSAAALVAWWRVTAAATVSGPPL
jgi:hypothetical protein